MKQYIKKINHGQMEFILRVKRWFNTPKPSNVIRRLNRIKNKNKLIISKNEGESCDKTQFPFMIKKNQKPSRLGIEMNFLNLIKGNSEKYRANIANIIFNEENK